MKTKIIEHEWTTVDPDDGRKDTTYLIAVQAPAISWESASGSQGTNIKMGWRVNQTDLTVWDAAEAREYIKLFEKIIEAEESGD